MCLSRISGDDSDDNSNLFVEGICISRNSGDASAHIVGCSLSVNSYSAVAGMLRTRNYPLIYAWGYSAFAGTIFGNFSGCLFLFVKLVLTVCLVKNVYIQNWN